MQMPIKRKLVTILTPNIIDFTKRKSSWIKRDSNNDKRVNSSKAIIEFPSWRSG